MPTIAEIANAGPNQPIVGLQATVKSCYDPKPFGQQGGTFQNAIIVDQSGEIAAQFVDVVVHQGEVFMATSSQTTKKELGQERVTWDGAAYTEIYKEKFRFTIKRKGFRSLSGGAPAMTSASNYTPAPTLAPGGPLGPAYGQAQTSPLPGAYQPQAGQPGAFPAQPGRRPDPEWGAGAGLATDQVIQGAGVGLPSTPAAPAWQPKPKKTVAEVRQFLLDQFAELAEAVGREWAASAGQSAGAAVPLGQLPPEVVAGVMAWSTSILIAHQRGDVVDEPVATGDDSEPKEDLDIVF